MRRVKTPRFNVQNKETLQWRCFSSIVDDFITDWMDLSDYEKWRQEEYGRNCGSVFEANQMTLDEALRRINFREEQEDGAE